MVENSTLATEKPKLISPVIKLALFWTIVSIIFIAPISIGGLRLKAFQDFYFLILFGGLLGESIFGYVYIIGYFILLPIITSTILGILSVYFKKFAFFLILISPFFVIIPLTLVIKDATAPSGIASSSPSELVAIPMSMLTPLLILALLSISKVITRPGNAILNSLKVGSIVLIIVTLLAILFPFLTRKAYTKARAQELVELKSENTFLKRPTYLPSNVTITTFNEKLVVDEGLWWDYTCKVPGGGSATIYIRQVPTGEYAHNLVWFEKPEFQQGRQEQFSQTTINGKGGLYSEPTQNYGGRSLRWESDGIFLEIVSDYNCSHSKNDLIKIAESMESH